ncbi:MAG: hypothetical protein AAFV85_08965 [Cyanobacteria bacterium J06634_6]
MKTIETTAQVSQEGTLVIELASDLPPGMHRAVLVIDEASLAQAEASEAELTQSPAAKKKVKKTAWTVLREQAGSVDMPEDWAKEHDHYLYGTPKRQP